MKFKRKKEYGQFFSKSLSCFGYNETPAFEQFPLTKEEAQEQDYKWENTLRGTYGKETKKWNEIPESIDEINFDVTSEIFVCVSCEKNYKIIENEFLFYKKLDIPLPQLCPDCRHARRMKSRGPNKLWHRQCMCESKNHNHQARCPIEFETSYSPQRKEIIYCEKCYQKEVY